MASKGLFGVPARPRRSARAVGQGRQMHRRITTTVVGALSCALVLMGGLAFADQGDPTQDPSEALTQPEVTASVELTQAPERTTESSPETTPTSVDSPTPTAPATTLPAEPAQDVRSKPAAEPSATTGQVPAQSAKVETDAILPLAAGADGGTAPYVYWNVKDTAGNLVRGAKFRFSYRSWWGWWSWAQGNNANPLGDCDGSCEDTSLDRDTEGGEFLLEHRGTSRNDADRLSTNQNYQVTPHTPPAGYVWAANSNSARSISGDSNTASWSGTYDFGTFTVEKVSYAPQCTAGYVYGITGSGQIKQVAPGGEVINLGSASGLSNANFNGLGIGTGGSAVYAYSRGGTGNSDSDVSIYRYDVATGKWSDTNHNVDSNTGSRTVTFVAGAINLDTAKYFLGGYSGTGNNRVFRLWEYDPTTNTSTYKGYISATGDGAANGDIAFNSNGDLFVVRGAGSTTTIYSVTAASLAAANGGLIASSAANAVSGTTDDVNGVAFDADGKGFLSSGSKVQSYNMPAWSGQSDVTSSLGGSTDLASCGSPPSITIEKVVEGGRVSATDQFTLTLKQGQTTVGSATTTGSSTGVQAERIGPLPTVRNVALSFAESAAGTANLANYVSSYRCLVDGVQTTQGDGTSGTITIPASGQVVNCQFYNSPLIAKVTIHKDITDALGLNPTPRQGWTVGAHATATTGTVTSTPNGATQETNATGNASWDFKFSGKTAVATINVSETMGADYQFLSGQCTVTHLNGTTTNTTLEGPNATGLPGIVPGDRVNCTYVNKPAAGTLAITKAFDGTVPVDSGTSTVFSGTYSCMLNSATVASGTWSRTGTGAASLTPAAGSPAANQIPAGASCSATETPPTGSTGLPNSSWEWGTASIAPSTVSVASGQTATITVTNTAKRVYGNFQVTKVIAEGSTADAGLTYRGNWTCTLGTETVTGTWGPIAAGAIWTSTDANQIPLGASCAVTTETRPEWPVADDHSYQWDGDPAFSAAVVAQSDNLATVTVTNTTKRVLGQVTWTKVAKGSGDQLAGSQWTLAGPGHPAPGTPVADCLADPCAGPDLDPAPGAFRIVDLAWGDYTLTETSAPPGYELVRTPRTFTVGDASLAVDLGAIENTQRTGPVLPLTGGLGRDQIIIIGALIALLAVVGFGARRTRLHRA